MIGFAFAINTAVIVGLQFLVLRRIAGRRRTRVLIVMVALWSVAWVVLGLTDLVSGTVAATAGVLLFHALFALGETLLQPTIPAITNDMAPDHLRGRYNAVNAGAFQAGTILGPVVAGFMLNHRWSTAFVAMIVLGCGVMVLLSLALERRISPLVNGLGGDRTPAVTRDPLTRGPAVTRDTECGRARSRRPGERSGEGRRLHAPLSRPRADPARGPPDRHRS